MKTKTKTKMKTKTKTKIKTKIKIKTTKKTKMNFRFCFHFVFHFRFGFCFLLSKSFCSFFNSTWPTISLAYDVLPNFPFITSETMGDYYL